MVKFCKIDKNFTKLLYRKGVSTSLPRIPPSVATCYSETFFGQFSSFDCTLAVGHENTPVKIMQDACANLMYSLSSGLGVW